MSRRIGAKRIDPISDGWPSQLREIRRQLGDRSSLLPHHFLEAVLPKIGGACVALFQDEGGVAGSPCGYAFLLPRGTGEDGATYTLRYEHVDGSPALGADAVTSAVGEVLAPEQKTHFYLPDADHTFTPTHIDLDGVICGRPDADEAAEVRTMQQSIWNSPPDGLYPSDLHSDEGGIGCSLVARVDAFWPDFVGVFPVSDRSGRCGDVHVPSGPAVGISTACGGSGKRRRRIAQLLKRLQARQAVEQGIDLINWTTDPLLFANALLNFNRLGAVACEFQPSLYFLSQRIEPGDCLQIEHYMGGSVKESAAGAARRGQPGPSEVETDPGLTIVNRADGAPLFGATTARIAIEIPSDWVTLQRQEMSTAQRWRDITNRLLDHYLGSQPGRYIITGTG